MKRQGFTLIELLAVIVIIALLLIIAVPMVMKARDKTLMGLSKEQERNLKYAGEMLGIDLDDYMSKVYNCKGGSWLDSDSKCTKVDVTENDKVIKKWVEVTVTLDDLKEHGYFDDVQSHCKGSITVTKQAQTGYGVDLGSVQCG